MRYIGPKSGLGLGFAQVLGVVARLVEEIVYMQFGVEAESRSSWLHTVGL